jgi:hypothetical protein
MIINKFAGYADEALNQSNRAISLIVSLAFNRLGFGIVFAEYVACTSGKFFGWFLRCHDALEFLATHYVFIFCFNAFNPPDGTFCFNC